MYASKVEFSILSFKLVFTWAKQIWKSHIEMVWSCSVGRTLEELFCTARWRESKCTQNVTNKSSSPVYTVIANNAAAPLTFEPFGVDFFDEVGVDVSCYIWTWAGWWCPSTLGCCAGLTPVGREAHAINVSNIFLYTHPQTRRHWRRSECRKCVMY